MLTEQTVAKMENLKFWGMAKCFMELREKSTTTDLTNEEFVGLLIDAENTFRENNRLKRLLENARLKQQACLENLDYRNQRGLHKKTIVELMSCQWIHKHQNILISGPTGIGKSFIACALGHYACKQGFSVFYIRAPLLFNILLQSRADGSYLKQLTKLAKYTVLIIDDIGLTTMNEIERKDFLEIIEDRSLASSTIIGSQLPIKDWYQIVGEPTMADSICDRLMHNAYKIELNGDSLRKNLSVNPEPPTIHLPDTNI